MAKGGSKPFGKARSLFLPDVLFRRGWARRALLLRQGVGAAAIGKPARCQDTLCISLVCCTTTEQGNDVFGTPWPNYADSN
jgi:hypothetical protein